MLNKVMLIGHLGKDPDVRTLDSEQKSASSHWQRRKRDTRCRMVLRYRTGQSGTTLYYGRGLLRLQVNIYTRETRFLSKVKSDPEVMRITVR